jgi:c-di-GMP-binding flagellar brake protein YcgR
MGRCFRCRRKQGRALADQYTEIIAGEKAVVETIRGLMELRTVCKMEIPRTRYSWITMLLDIRSTGLGRVLLVDRVAGFDAALGRSPRQEVSLEFMDRGGVPCLFTTRVLSTRHREIWAELPREIHRIQRRRYFRIEALLDTEIRFLREGALEEEKGIVKNYSAGGAAFYPARESGLKPDDVLRKLLLTIPGEKGATSFSIPAAAVRRVEPASLHEGRILAAVEFTELPKEIRDGLVAFIFKQERVVIQKIRR